MASGIEGASYNYPDPLDEITHGREPYRGYWNLSEGVLLDAFMEVAPDLFPQKPRRLLDAGCGDGRLLGRFAHFFEEITALDPDRARLRRAHRHAIAQNLPARLAFTDRRVEDYEHPEGFDCIWCGWVLEHVHTDVLPELIAQLAKLLRQGGVILLATSHSRAERDRFTCVSKEQDVHQESGISAAEFNSLLSNGERVLPVHQFAYRGLAALLASNGLSVLSHRVFHELGDFGSLDRILFRDWLINLSPSLRERLGEDQFLFCARPLRTHEEETLLAAASRFDKYLAEFGRPGSPLPWAFKW